LPVKISCHNVALVTLLNMCRSSEVLLLISLTLELFAAFSPVGLKESAPTGNAAFSVSDQKVSLNRGDHRQVFTSFLMKRRPPQAEYLIVEQDGSDIWRAADLIEILRGGGVGVIPTDTGYCFVTSIASHEGVQRILKLINAKDERKPLSLLCGDLPTIQKFAFGVDRPTFKLLKNCLPGPYTFILRASSNLPRMWIKSGKRKYRRETVGIRMPDDPICQAVLEQLGEPLLSLSVPVDETIGAQLVCLATVRDNWCNEVDFTIDAGERSVEVSTIYDLSAGERELVREGQGPLID